VISTTRSCPTEVITLLLTRLRMLLLLKPAIRRESLEQVVHRHKRESQAKAKRSEEKAWKEMAALRRESWERVGPDPKREPSFRRESWERVVHDLE
jgi:hypothetical protein